jgi:putative spermidine/putrescine transport system permease protein
MGSKARPRVNPVVSTTSVAVRRNLSGTLFRWVVLLSSAVFFTAPLLTLARHSIQNVPAFLLGRANLLSKWSLTPVTKAFSDEAFWRQLSLSLRLAAGTALITLLLLVPTAVWVHLRLPRARPIVEFFTVLPYMVPPIALVAGIKIVQPHVRWFLNSDYSLVPFYVILALPFTYRSIDAGLRAIDLRTIVDAARSLGSGWVATLLRVVLPNLRSALISASFLTMAVVVGEFTLASLLLKPTLPMFQREFTSREPQAGYALNLIVLMATTLVFVLISVLSRPRQRRRNLFSHQTAISNAQEDFGRRSASGSRT